MLVSMKDIVDRKAAQMEISGALKICGALPLHQTPKAEALNTSQRAAMMIGATAHYWHLINDDEHVAYSEGIIWDVRLPVLAADQPLDFAPGQLVIIDVAYPLQDQPGIFIVARGLNVAGSTRYDHEKHQPVLVFVDYKNSTKIEKLSLAAFNTAQMSEAKKSTLN